MDQDTTFLSDGIAIFKHHWTKYINIKRDYIEKLCKCLVSATPFG